MCCQALANNYTTLSKAKMHKCIGSILVSYQLKQVPKDILMFIFQTLICRMIALFSVFGFEYTPFAWTTD